MMTVARPRTRPPAVQAAPPPSNVVELRPGIRLPPAPEAPAKARPRARPRVTKAPDLLKKVTKETGKNTSESNDLLRGPGLTQAWEHAPLSPMRENPSSADPTFQRLVARMPATKLRETFALEANTHRNMMGRAREGGYTVDPAFHDFRAFLAHVGPRPSEAWTLDRLDPRNPVYGPGLVRWADKRQQANNRADTVHLTMGRETRPLADWARLTGQERRTLAKRIERGWSHAEAIQGRRLGSDEPVPISAPTVLPEPPPCVLDEWPEGATVELWEKGFEAFRKGPGKRYGSAFRRAVFFCWIVGNGIAKLKEKLQAAHPGFEDPDCDQQPKLYGDPTFDHYLKLCAAHWAQHWSVWEDEECRGLYQSLKTYHPGITDIVNAHRIVQKAETPVERW